MFAKSKKKMEMKEKQVGSASLFGNHFSFDRNGFDINIFKCFLTVAH